MIVTHPFLFNTIVVLFIAFTAAWVVFAVVGRRMLKLKNRMAELETEKEKLRLQALDLEAQIHKCGVHPLSGAPVIPFSSSAKASQIN